MPGPAIHHMIADQLKNEIISKKRVLHNDPIKNRKLKALLDNPSNLPYLFFGCQGPDYLFFHFKDWHALGGSAFEEYLKIYDRFEEMKDDLKGLVPKPVLDQLETIESVIERNAPIVGDIREYIDKVAQTLDALTKMMVEGLKALLSQINVFDLKLEHPYRDGVKWWWFDILHYRKSGEFANELLERTKDIDSPLHLYALGYLTHYAGDTVGHPYVNLFSGGPYRSHAQRHKTGEGFQDVYNFPGDFNSSDLHAYYNFNFNGRIDTSDDNRNEHVPNPATELKDDLAKLIADAMNKVYSQAMGSRISANDIKNAYRVYYKWLRQATTLSNSFPKPKPYGLSAKLAEIWDEALDNTRDIVLDLSNNINSSGNFGIVALFEALGEAIVSGLLIASEFTKALLSSIGTVAGSVLYAGINLLYELIYDAFQNFRLIIALKGFAFPMQEHLSEPRFKQFIKPSNSDENGISGSDIINMLPLRRIDPENTSNPFDDWFNLSSHLVYPFVPGLREQNKEQMTVSSKLIQSYLDQTLKFIISGEIPFKPILQQSGKTVLDGILEFQKDASKTEADFKAFIEKAGLGNAITLTAESYKRSINNKPLVDFNLDGDRGYGYPCWKKSTDKNDNSPGELFPEPGDLDNPIALKFIQK